MVKDQIRCPIDKHALQCINPGIRPELRIYGCLIKSAHCHDEDQRHKHMEKSVHVTAPEYSPPADRQTVIKVLLPYPKQIEVFDKGCENSQTHTDPP